MSGIYIHIPFCSRKCNYCDFYSIVPLKRKSDFVDALCIEIDDRSAYLGDTIVDTLYFGGGTPSILSLQELEKILTKIRQNFTLSEKLELTLEANPENINEDYIKGLRSLGVNRLSIGTQSFHEEDLSFLKRSHNSKQAIKAIGDAAKYGFDNLSADLIYGLPLLTEQRWEENLKQMFDLPIQHLSAYHLTYEPGTLLYKKLKQGKFEAKSEQESVRHFELLLKYVDLNGFEAYEISNFAKNGLYSRHNMSYWQQKPYLGLGPSAHSFNQETRDWNISNLLKYIEGINIGKRVAEEEFLSNIDKYNEFVITNLRTKWGVDMEKITKAFGISMQNKILSSSKPFIDEGLLEYKQNKISLTTKGVLVSDFIMEKLFILSD